MLMGTRRLYRFADRNPAIRLRVTSYMHDAVVLGYFQRFVAVGPKLIAFLEHHHGRED